MELHLILTAVEGVYSRCNVAVSDVPYLFTEGYRWALQTISEEKWQTLMTLLINNNYLVEDQANCLTYWLPGAIHGA